jgi:hypothetical protein
MNFLREISIESIRASNLFVDPAVQRAEEVPHVDRLAREWRDDYVGVLIGSKRKDGRVYVLDGFQRLLAKRDRQGMSDYAFTVQVYTGLSIKEEAEIFLAHNRGRKAVTPYAKWRVSLTAGDPVAVAIHDVAESFGLQLGPKSGPNTIGCVSTLERIVGGSGRNIDEQKEVLYRCLDTYRAVYGNTAEFWRNEVLEGLAMFYREHGASPNFSEDALRKALSRVTVLQLLASAKAKNLGNNRPSRQMAQSIQELYDKRRTKGRLVAV